MGLPFDDPHESFDQSTGRSASKSPRSLKRQLTQLSAILMAVALALAELTAVVRNTGELRDALCKQLDVGCGSGPSTDVGKEPPSPPVPPPSSVQLECFSNILPMTWHLESENDADEEAQEFADADYYQFKGMHAIRVDFDLHGLLAEEGVGKNDSAVVLYAKGWYVASLAKWGKNEKDGRQITDIPLSAFIGLPEGNDPRGGPIDLGQAVSSAHVRFWHRDHFVVEIFGIHGCRNES